KIAVMPESLKIRASASARTRPAEDKSGSLPPMTAFSAWRTITTTGCADAVDTDTKTNKNTARAFIWKSYCKNIRARRTKDSAWGSQTCKSPSPRQPRTLSELSCRYNRIKRRRIGKGASTAHELEQIFLNSAIKLRPE